MSAANTPLSLDLLLDNLPGMAYRCLNDEHWTMQFVSAGARELTGYDADDLIGNRRLCYADLIVDEDRQHVQEVVQQALDERRSFRIVYRIVRADGRLRWVWEQGNAIYGDDGRLTALEGFICDISDNKRAEDSVRESEERFKKVVQATTDAVWDWDLINDQVWWSEGVESLFGIPQQAMGPGWGLWSNRIHPEDQARVIESLHQALDGRQGNWAEEYRFLCGNGRYAHVLDRGSVIRDAEGKAVRMVGGMVNLSDKRRGEEELRLAIDQLRASEEQYRLLFNNHPHAMGVYDVETLRILAVNHSAVLNYGYTEAELLGMRVDELWAPAQRTQVEAYVRAIKPGAKNFLKARQQKKDGTPIEVEITSDGIDFNGRPARLVLAEDVTERLRAERELGRVSRARSMLAACSEALIRAEEETALLQEVCRIIVEIGGYRMAWVGYAQDDEAHTVLPMAHAGAELGYLDDIHITWDEGQLIGRGPVGRLLRDEEEYVLIPDLTQDPSFNPWLERAMQRGYRSVVYLPLRGRERTFGTLGLFAAEISQISPDELSLLQSLVADLAFGIDNMRTQLARRQLELATLKLAAGVSATTDGDFFRQLALNMAEAVGGFAGFVVRLLQGQRCRARIIAGVANGQDFTAADYDIAGTACEQVLRHQYYRVDEKGLEMFSGSPELESLGGHAYVGQRMDNSAGEPAGLIFVLFDGRQRPSPFTDSTLQVFAARASAELEREAADARIRQQASLLDQAKDAIVVRDMEHRVQFWNKGAERLYGWSAAEAVGRPLGELLSSDMDELAQITRHLIEDGEWTGEINEKRKDGGMLTVEAHLTLVRDTDGEPQSIFAIKTDISQRKADEQEILHLAFHDGLTQLPNRVLLVERLQHALVLNARNQRQGALLFIDLDNFKTLNDTLGHDKGDLLLQKVAHRLLDCVRESDTVARLGGDEFVVMIENLSPNAEEAANDVKHVGEKILESLNHPFELAGASLYSTPSIGITLFSDTYDSVNELLKRADLAMYQAKAAGRNTLRFFDPAMQARVSSRAALEGDMRQGLHEGQFLLHYQPQFDALGRATGVEALVRWRHPRLGMVSPAEFIPLAEESGLIVALGRWVLETACRQLAAWADDPQRRNLAIAVNVSAHQFRHPSFVDEVVEVLRQTGARPECLKLELTESLLVDDMQTTIAKMSTLKDHGVRFSLDDFGTGYSSLYYLKHLPLDQLKIDQSFVRDILSDPNDAAIVRTIITLGQSLGLAVIAEGVETEAQRDFLAFHECHAFQGYLFSRPLPLDQLESFLARLSARQREL